MTREREIKIRKNKIGMFYGSLEILALDHRDKNNNAVWLCRCTLNGCNNEVVVNNCSLAGGRRQVNCGCLERKRKASLKKELDDIGITNALKWQRINKGNWTLEKALSTKIGADRYNMTRYTHNGVTKTLSEWADEIGITKSCLWNRIKKLEWSIEEALTTPLKRHDMTPYTHNGVTKTLSEWAKETGLMSDCIWHRIKKLEWSIEEALTIPLYGRPIRD